MHSSRIGGVLGRLIATDLAAIFTSLRNRGRTLCQPMKKTVNKNADAGITANGVYRML